MFVANVVSLIIAPSLIVVGFFYVTHRLFNGWLDERTISGTWAALTVFGIGMYFVGHPLYPALVPLIRASTSWVFAMGAVYITLGFTAAMYVRYRRFSAIGCWFAALLGVVIAFVAANGFEVEAVTWLLGGTGIGPSLYLSLPLALMFPFGYDSRLDHRQRLSLSLCVVFTLYALVLANSIPLREVIRHPAAMTFVAFGCVGVLLGTPLHVLGTALAASPNKR